MTPYSAAADGSFSRRDSSRVAALYTSSGSPASSIRARSSVSSACCSSPSPSSSWIAFSCWRRKNSRWPFSISDCICDWMRLPSSSSSSSRFRRRSSSRSRSSTFSSSRSCCFSSVLIRRSEATKLTRAVGSSTLASAICSSSGQVRDEPDDALEERMDVAGERLDLVGLDDDVGHLRELAGQVRLVLDATVEADALEPADEDAQRPVGNLDHLVDHGRRPDLVEIVPAGLLHVLRARGDEREDARLVRDDVVHEPDRAVLADRQRRERAREHDRLLERENGECGRNLVLVRLALLDVEELFGFAHGLFTSIGTRPRGAGRGAIGNTILSRPCS